MTWRSPTWCSARATPNPTWTSSSRPASCLFATFGGPARAIRCALAIRAAADGLGLAVRAGVHVGEAQREDGGGLSGLAVHIGARIMAEAEPGEVLASGTVKDLVVGSGLRFAERGTRTLRGVPGTWPLFAVAQPGEA